MKKGILEKVILAAIASSMILPQTISATTVTQENQSINVRGIQSSISIIEASGDLETASVEWKGVSGATGYNVYYKSVSESKYKQLDNELIRQYPSYFRADAVGLKEGSYVLKVIPIVNGKEDETKRAITKTIDVKSHTREGFAFAKESPMGTASGGYNNDGTLADNAQIIYITADTVNTVKLDVITNSKGKVTSCTGLTDILSKRQKGYDKRPLIIRLVGEIKKADISGLNGKGYIQIKGCYNLTFEGIGEDATINGWGVLVRDAHNVEIRNLGVMLFPDDGISIDTNNENVWIHNNDIFYGSAGSDKDQVKGDGSCDVKGFSDYVTVAYNHFYDSGKCSLCGMGDSKEFHVSYHHNWFDHSDSRHPRIRVGTVHIYNNYFDGNAKYGVGVTKGSSAFVEANSFRNCKNPMMSSMQGTDSLGAKGTFSGEAGGMIKAYNNKIEGASSLIYANENATSFDAYLATSRNEKVPTTYKTVSGGTTYNNFDTSASMYSYTPDAPEDVASIVTKYAGRVNGGDLSWKFTTADDTDYSVNNALMEKIRAYKSEVVSIGGNSVAQIPQIQEPTKDPEASKKDQDTKIPEDKTQGGTTSKVEEQDVPVVPSNTEIGSLSNAGMRSSLVDLEDKEFKNAVYVSPTGVANSDGSYNNPLDLETALNQVNEGKATSILLKEGTYKFSKQITISNSGTENTYNVLKGCKGAKVVLDFSSQPYNMKDTSINFRGIQLNGNYWYVSNITIKGAADNGMMLSGSHNVIERCIFDGNRDTGLQISRRSSSVTNFKDWPSYNYILNCTSKNNCDPATYENADGFAAKLTCGEGNVFDGCLSYNNSDDGWDLFAKKATGSTGVVTIRNSIAMRNGKTESGVTNSNCDGNGFKLGGSGVPTAHVVTNCIAIENLHHGFTDNNNPAALKITNCTAFENNLGGKKNNFSLYRCKDAVVSNCISYTTNTKTSDKYVNVVGAHIVLNNSGKWYKVTDSQAINTGSSKLRGEVLQTGTRATDFVNSSVPSVGTDFDKVWRNADGTLNTHGVAIIASSSKYATFSKDGGVIGARLGDNNKVYNLNINIK